MNISIREKLADSLIELAENIKANTSEIDEYNTENAQGIQVHDKYWSFLVPVLFCFKQFPYWY